MGFSTGSHRRARFNSEINVTPFVDVMLVLLVIFMVTTPMMVNGIDIDLPKTSAKPLVSAEEPLVISIDGAGKIYLQENPMPDQQQLIAKLLAIVAENGETKIFIRGDHMVSYGRIMELFGVVRAAGLENVSLVTEDSD